MNKELLKGLNEQIKYEIESANIYLAMSAYFEEVGLDGMAHWLYVHHIEETDHAMKIYHHIIERGEKPEILQIDKPDTDFKGTLDVWKKALEHETFISQSIHKLMKLARDKDEYGSFSMLQWFVDEQVEEEDLFGGIVDKLEFSEESKNAIMQLNAKMAQRMYAPSIPDGLLGPATGQEE